MIITCPSCETHFSVPDSALGARGRTLRCARCGHKWHQQPLAREDDVPLEMPPSSVTRGRDPVPERDFGSPSGFGLGSDDASFSFGSSPMESEGEGRPSGAGASNGEEDPFARIAELMMGSQPEAIPDVFASPPPPPKAPRHPKGGAGLALLFVAVVLAAAGVGLYFFRDKVVDAYPEATQYYVLLGLNSEVVGAGLTFRNTNSERMMQDGTEVLVVRGVIVNTVDQPREIPLLRLALYDNDKLLQDKLISPPQTALEARGTVGFRITLDQPDAHAGRFEVTFAPNKAPPAKP